MSFFNLFGQSAQLIINLHNCEERKLVEVRLDEGSVEKCPVYLDGETLSGEVNVKLKKPGSKLEHHGVRIEFVGQIEMYYDRGHRQDFISLVRELARPGVMTSHESFSFSFNNVEKPFESYVGSNVRLRYYLRATLVRRLSDVTCEKDLFVHTLAHYPESRSSIKMEVGIEDSLHIEFEYNKSKYNLNDVIVGKIHFLLVRVKIKYMELQILKIERTGSGPSEFSETETVARYEIMDGAPVRGESIPIRLFLAGYELTPSMKDFSKQFTVRYFLNLVLVDEEDRRYYKQQEITIYRKADVQRKTPLQRHEPYSIDQSQASVANQHGSSDQPQAAAAIKDDIQQSAD